MNGDFRYGFSLSVSSSGARHQHCGAHDNDRRGPLGSSDMFRDVFRKIQADPEIPESMKDMIEGMLRRALGESMLTFKPRTFDRPDGFSGGFDRPSRPKDRGPERPSGSDRTDRPGPLVGPGSVPKPDSTAVKPQEKPPATDPGNPVSPKQNGGVTGPDTSDTAFLDKAVTNGLLKGDAGLIEEVKNLASKDPDLKEALARYFEAGYPLDINEGNIPDTNPGTQIVGRAESRVYRQSGDYAGTTITIEDRPRPEDRTKTVAHELTHMLNFAKIVPGKEHDEQFHASMEALTDGAKTQGFKLIG